MHVEQHEIRVLDELLHSSAESGTGCTVDNSVIGRYAEVDGVHCLKAVTILASVIVDKLCNAVSLADCNNGGLWAQNSWDKVSASNVAYT